MSLPRRIRRANGMHRRAIPDDAAALVFTRPEADVYEVHYLAPKGAPTNGRTPEHAQIAIACAEYARDLLHDEGDDEQTTTGAPSADSNAEHGPGNGGDHGED